MKLCFRKYENSYNFIERVEKMIKTQQENAINTYKEISS